MIACVPTYLAIGLIIVGLVVGMISIAVIRA